MEEIIVPAIAGLLAGVGTGFAGLSAAAFIAPMLIAFLGVDSFSAIGIALASDVLASAASAATYRKFRNTDLKRALPLCLTVIAFAVIGTVASHGGWCSRHLRWELSFFSFPQRATESRGGSCPVLPTLR